MAEGWAKHLKNDVFEAYSAGIEKAGLDPLAIKVMAEVGIDISKQESKLISELKEKDFDYVVVICDEANERCPTFSSKARKIYHPFDNPPKIALKLRSKDEIFLVYRRVRDEIKDFIGKLG